MKLFNKLYKSGHEILDKDNILIEAEKEFFNIYKFNSNGIDYIKDIYKAIDELTEIYKRDTEVLCYKGCGKCCNQLIGCTQIEVKIMIDYIDSLNEDLKTPINLDLIKYITEFKMWLNIVMQNNPKNKPLVITELVKNRYREISCVFLKDNICRIYPVRPMICRTVKTIKNLDGNGTESVRLAYNHIALELIKKEQVKSGNIHFIAPIRLWLFLNNKERK